jgi:putative transposase
LCFFGFTAIAIFVVDIKPLGYPDTDVNAELPKNQFQKKGTFYFFIDIYICIKYFTPMPRTARASVGNICYHVINRGNGHATVFHNQTDYLRFTEMMQQACERLPLRLVSWCLMPNHFHLVLWPYEDGDLSRWMQWLMTCHVRRHHRHYNSSGHIWQGRFKAFPIQQDGHYLTVIRYVESNPLRANLVKRAEHWKWSSLYALSHRSDHQFLSNGPVDRPRNWRVLVNQRGNDTELEMIKNCLNRGSPFGDSSWVTKIAVRLGLESSVNPRGRPKRE